MDREEVEAKTQVLTDRALLHLFDGYVHAAKYLKQVARGEMTADRARVRVCMFLVEQERGRAKQQLEHTTKDNQPIEIKLIEVRHSPGT